MAEMSGHVMAEILGQCLAEIRKNIQCLPLNP